MTLPTLLADMTGNTEIQDAMRLSWNAQTNATFAGTAQPYICAGSGAPTFAAPAGSLYLRTDGGVNSRAYMNTNGTGGGWTPLTNAA